MPRNGPKSSKTWASLCLHEAMPPGAHAEYKFRGLDGAVFDITKDEWDGSQPVSPEDRVVSMPQAAE